jgi:hypothetical protein
LQKRPSPPGAGVPPPRWCASRPALGAQSDEWDRRAAHGTLWRLRSSARIGRPSIQYSGVVLPSGPNSWPPNIPSACSVPRARTLSVSRIRIAYQCDPFATYRQVSPLHHATDTLVRRYGDHAVSHDFFHRHRCDSLAVARKCVNNFTFRALPS